MHVLLIILRFFLGRGNPHTDRFRAIAVRPDGRTFCGPAQHDDWRSSVAGWLGFYLPFSSKHVRVSWMSPRRDRWLQSLGKQVRSICSGVIKRFRCTTIAKD